MIDDLLDAIAKIDHIRQSGVDMDLRSSLDLSTCRAILATVAKRAGANPPPKPL